MLTAPLRDRFGVVNRLEFYTDEELKTIILRSAAVLDVEDRGGGRARTCQTLQRHPAACQPPPEAGT